ncbi:MAG: O-methyltransferase [Lachnospiraceae bacterium]|nr:O-methyltransferase [Lachnospiraceae bacterium]
MITNPSITEYINSLNLPEDPLLYEIEKEARKQEVPIIRTEMKNLIKVLLQIKKPEKILEVGTAVGFSALFMSRYLEPGAAITTIERYEPRIEKAKENFKKADEKQCITLLEGDAMEILKNLEETYDFIFMDAAKGQYIHFLPDILRLLKKGGLLVSDNALQEGELVKSRYAVTRRNRTIHSRMREYLYTITHMEELSTVILPLGDGVTVSYRL